MILQYNLYILIHILNYYKNVSNVTIWIDNFIHIFSSNIFPHKYFNIYEI